MARIRTIKPEFFTSEDIVEMSPLARLLYIALWCEADKEGRLTWKPKTFKMRYLPADDCDVDAICGALVTRRLIVIYGDGLAVIPSFKNHQHINPREKESVLPAPTTEDLTRAARVSDATVTHRKEGRKEGREGKGTKDMGADAPVTSDKKPSEDDANEPIETPGIPKCPIGDIVNAYHDLMPMNPKVKVLNDARKRSIAARWREASRLDAKPFGYSTVADGVASWRAFFETCAESPFLTGKANGRPGQPPFLADVDFIFSPSGFAKILENKYHRDWHD